MRGASLRKLLLPAAVIVALFVVVLGGLIAVPHVLYGRNLAPIELSQGELDEINNKRYEAWFREWYDEKHPTLLSVVPTTPPSAGDYRDRLTEARRRHALSLALGASPKADAFGDWQEAARKKLVELLFGGDIPERQPLNVEAPPPSDFLEGQSRLTFRRYRLRTIGIDVGRDRTLRAFVAVPKDAPEGARFPAIIALPGHFGVPESCFGLDQLLSKPLDDPGAYMYAYGHMLANAGYVVVAPDTGYCPFLCKNVKEEDLPAGWAWDGMRVADAMAAVTAATMLPEVDPERIGCYGHSLGGEVAMFLGALDTRVKVTVISGYLSTYHPDEGCRCHGVPNLESFLRYADVCALIAPRHLLDIEGIDDRADGARKGGTDVRYAFGIAGAPERFMQLIHDGTHVFYAGPEVIEFLDAALRNG